MPEASPQKWHLAHTTWFFETFVLAMADASHRSPHPAYRVMFNSYYQGVGPQFPRPSRGLLTRPSLAEVIDWRGLVDAAMLRLIAQGEASLTLQPAWGQAQLCDLIELGLQHEQQHQELMRTDLLALLALNPIRPSLNADDDNPASTMRHAGSSDWLAFAGGLTEIGHDGKGFCFDHELPSHRVWLAPFELAQKLVTQLDYQAFIDAGGYREPRYWLSEGWQWVSEGKRNSPQYWRHDLKHGWRVSGLYGERDSSGEAVAHLSYYEADAYARWAGARLPTEQEWEAAARAHGEEADDLFGECWQWTSSSFATYPGYQAAEGAIGEYNGKFMVNQQVLRGSSRYTPHGHARISYRNFLPASATWQRSGLRLAR